MYEYRALVTRVVDADTLDVTIDLGLHTYVATRVRLFGLNAPEARTPTGPAATEFTRAWIDRLAGAVLVRTEKDKTEKYGRYLAVVWDRDKTRSLNADLLTAGHAQPA